MKKFIIAAVVTTLAVPVFAAANDAIDKAAKEKGAVKTPSGMVYQSLKEGKGSRRMPPAPLKSTIAAH